ncbi:MAG: hypothetical protein LW860_04720 [Xanthomonadaceae bacterium]|jgi:hypothetical protein|nr:hypothetical protein [Xanthomonadaceae bacterium]
MSRIRILSSIILAAVAGGAAAVGTSPPAADPAQSLRTLQGRYTSVAPEPWGAAYGFRDFAFDRGRWSLRFTLSLDAAGRQPVFTFRTGGGYRVLDASTRVPGAFDAVFLEEAKRVTLHADDPALAAAFGLDRCGLAVGVEQDISVRGCAGWKPVVQCGEDHDLLALDADGGLRFGVRPADNDLCSADKRPTALLPAVRRVD